MTFIFTFTSTALVVSVLVFFVVVSVLIQESRDVFLVCVIALVIIGSSSGVGFGAGVSVGIARQRKTHKELWIKLETSKITNRTQLLTYKRETINLYTEIIHDNFNSVDKLQASGKINAFYYYYKLYNKLYDTYGDEDNPDHQIFIPISIKLVEGKIKQLEE